MRARIKNMRVALRALLAAGAPLWPAAAEVAGARPSDPVRASPRPAPRSRRHRAPRRRRSLARASRKTTAATWTPTTMAAPAAATETRSAGRRWLQRRFVDALVCLAHQLAPPTASPNVCTVVTRRPCPALQAAA
jgi:hypothetical protein